MGVVLTSLGLLQLLVIWRNFKAKWLAALLFLGAFTVSTAGAILALGGLVGHTAVVETVWMFYAAAHKLACSAALSAHPNERIRP
jgi:hypothetical protein